LQLRGVYETETTSQQSDAFNRFRLLVEAHFTEHWEVARYAGMLNLTAERLNRLCRQQAGVTAFEIVRDRLLQEACRRLIYIVVPVSQLAYELGFADAGYFCRFFKRHTRLSPNQYRKKHSGYELDE
jgi:AraC family transcriptional activator of pobA